MAWLRILTRGIDGIETLAIAGAALCVLVTMLVVSADVVMRYFFNQPLGWVYDLVSNYLMVGAFFLAVSETFRRGGHVAVDLFRNMLRPGLRRRLDALSALLVMPVLLAMIVTGWNATTRAFERGEVIPGIVTWPVWASHVFVPLGIGLLLLRVVAHFLDLARGGDGHVPETAGHLPAEPADKPGPPQGSGVQ